MAEPNYTTLALTSTWFGWRAMNGTCKSIAKFYNLTQDEYESMVSATSLCLAVAVGMADGYSKTLPEDEEYLRTVRKCREYVLEHGSHGEAFDELGCPDGISEYGYAIETAVRYRILKKQLLEAVVQRLNNDCVSEYSEVGIDLCFCRKLRALKNRLRPL